jgi:hypothetical protein
MVIRSVRPLKIMAQTHTWFATSDDLPLILNWLCEAGATLADTSVPITDLHADGSERVLHFSSLGPIEYWPASISLGDYPNNSPQWRDAVLTKLRQEENTQLRMVNPSKTPAAGLILPVLRDGNYWVSGCLWFPTSNLKTTFPELLKICQRFERWIRKFPVVFDNRKGENTTKYNGQIGHGGIVQCINALPNAMKLLDEGANMIDYMTSPKSCADYISRWSMFPGG